MTALDRMDALKAAEDYVIRACEPPMKPNGYPVDGWRPPSHEERTSILLRVAAFLAGDDPEEGL